jgi:hypothetical protein
VTNVANIENSIFHPQSAEHISEVCRDAILKEWMHPCIEPAASSGYSNSDASRSSFIVKDMFVGDFRVTIEKL